jgi:hypothetical protein
MTIVLVVVATVRTPGVMHVHRAYLALEVKVFQQRGKLFSRELFEPSRHLIPSSGKRKA